MPPYWAEETYTGTDRDGREHTFVATGWAVRSQAEAEQDATARAKRIGEIITIHDRFARACEEDLELPRRATQSPDHIRRGSRATGSQSPRC